MPAAGEYVDRLQWLQRTKSTPDGFGQRQDTYPSQGHLWAVLEDLVANRENPTGSEVQKTTATVRIRNQPGVVAGDRLQDLDGRVWKVKSAVPGDNELTCDVEEL